MKKILLILLLIQVTFSATPEEVKQFIMLSKSDRDLTEMEQMIDKILPPDSTKNTEKIEILFQEYLEKNLSEDEMTELIKLLKNPLIQELYSMDSDLPESELNEFNLSLSENPLSTERLDLNEKLIENMFDVEDMQMITTAFQNKLMKRMGLKPEENKIDKEQQEEMVTAVRQELKLPMLYTTQTMSVDELKELLEITNISIMKKSDKVTMKATMYALDSFLDELINNMIKSQKEYTQNTSTE